MQCALFGNAGSTRGATLYTTFTPCIECSKMAIGVGITRIVVLGRYPEDVTGLLKETNIQMTQLDHSSLEKMDYTNQSKILSFPKLHLIKYRTVGVCKKKVSNY